ncbi:glycosyltransferase [Neorhizobium sp. SOG26]|uniref:glycosyltransferase n=1 Tax=Neorhizobium sp. SOG26 TaxID=2060726 RepID=UPI001FE17F76|nr:glycosyltransferase [Neorhizobium sp. SOG26]
MDALKMPASRKDGSSAGIGIVVIGRNEGKRLLNCLRSVKDHSRHVVYVDSGSSDGSVDAATSLCARVVCLDMTTPFTAARARNTGFHALMQIRPETEFVQFVDGDCRLDPKWLDEAATFLAAHPDLALVFGRRREIYPNVTIYNTLCDREWDGPAGEAIECGGDVLIRTSALKDVGGYLDDLIGGEEPELCVRLRTAGWKIWRLPVEMTRHDAAITRFSQWWRRSVRCGHAYAQVSSLHSRSPFRIWSRNVRRSVVWGGLIPFIAVGGCALHPASLALLAIYPLQVIRLARRATAEDPIRWQQAAFAVAGKFPEFQGIVQFHLNRLLGRHQILIEYKEPLPALDQPCRLG